MENDAKMNLLDFEDHTNGTILARVREYYRDGCVKSFEKKDKNYYTSVVAGTYDYNVTIGLGAEGVVLFLDCDCPYDMGPHCKHEAAVLYALRKVLKDGPAGLTVDSPGGLAASAGKIMKHSVKRKGRATGTPTGRSASSSGSSPKQAPRSGPGRSSRSFWQPTRGSPLSGRSS